MFTKRICIIAGLVLLVFALVVFAQNNGNRILFQGESLKVVVDKQFPNVLDSEIHVGSKHYPYFRTEGDQNGIKHAEIDINLQTAVSFVRKETEDESYVLYFFSVDRDGKVFGLFDLNQDGHWDVKKCPTSKEKNFIWLRDEWFEVDKIEGLLSKMPTAVKGEKQYRFDGSWTLN